MSASFAPVLRVLLLGQLAFEQALLRLPFRGFDLELSLKDLEQAMMCFEQERRAKGFTTLIYPNMSITLICPCYLTRSSVSG
jgi:hypothetical protein|uniref:Uncharacterized protein n=1 Tax=Picea glauca TaxID=3330 RepID=A0A101LUJ0_PICGL|nr:hypothetical protein ABT39_MTgene2432 [Picea glauca]